MRRISCPAIDSAFSTRLLCLMKQSSHFFCQIKLRSQSKNIAIVGRTDFQQRINVSVVVDMTLLVPVVVKGIFLLSAGF